MKFVALPIIFAVVESIVLLLLVSSNALDRIRRNKLDTILLFVSLSILFNLSLYAEEKLLLPNLLKDIITIASGSAVLLVFSRLTRLGKDDGDRCSPLKSLTTFSITFILINGLIFLLCMETLSSGIRSVAWFALSSSVLFLCTYSGICGSGKLILFRSGYKSLTTFYVGTFLILIAGLVLENRIALILFTNISLLLMVVYNLKGDLKKAPEDEFDKLEDYNLTKRQLEVAMLIMEGLTYAEIGDKLSIAENTATKHGSDIFAKTNSEDRSAFYAKFYPEFFKSRTLEMNSSQESSTEKSA